MVRDELAVIRSHLANERTALAFIRTALAFLAAAAGLIHFFPDSVLYFVGWLLGGSGLIILAVGVIRFFHFRRRINTYYSK